MRRSILLLLPLPLTGPARAWWTKGHEVHAEAAVMALPPEAPAVAAFARVRAGRP